MQEWWSYTLSDFLMFSPRTYYRLLERYNTGVWPGHLLTLALGFGIVGTLRLGVAWHGRAISAIMAILWAWVGWAFVWRNYATINWAATYIFPVFALEALLLVWAGVVRPRLRFGSWRDAGGRVGIGLFILALILYPTFAPLLGRGWEQAEVFGVAPDPTAIATLGVLLLAEGRAHWELMAIPLLWCILSGATLWAMGSPEAWVPPVAGVLAMTASGLKSRPAHRSRLS